MEDLLVFFFIGASFVVAIGAWIFMVFRQAFQPKEMWTPPDSYREDEDASPGYGSYFQG